MTGEERIACVQDQCNDMWRKGKELPLDCPYCFSHVAAGAKPCCELLEKAVNAVIERQVKVDKIDFRS